MTAPAIPLSLSTPATLLAKKKRLLLVDACTTKRDLRAGVMRKMGIEVDCAADISEARSLWRADWYGLVLMNVGAESGVRDEFCDEIRGVRPPQKIAFLVGRPEFIAAMPAAGGVADVVEVGDPRLWAEVVAKLFTQSSKKGPQTWGIQEACWRISAVRSLQNPWPKDGGRAMNVTSPAAVILLIDDDPIGVQTRTAVLERNGYRVLIASTAAEGLRVFSEQRVDLVMSDHFLRDKRGTALAAELKRLKPRVPVMIYSGATEMPEGIEKADAFVTKLETIPAMLEEIARLLQLQSRS